MLVAVEVARSDRRQPGGGDPAERPVPVEELEAVDEAVEPSLVPPVPARRPDRVRLTPVGMRCENGDAQPARFAEGVLDDRRSERLERAEPDREGMRGPVWIRVVVGELEPGMTSSPYCSLARRASRSIAFR
jgi:hypothetical protein